MDLLKPFHRLIIGPVECVVIFLISSIGFAVQGQGIVDIPVYGTVQTIGGTPIANVSVTFKDPRYGLVGLLTDESGHFFITVPSTMQTPPMTATLARWVFSAQYINPPVGGTPRYVVFTGRPSSYPFFMTSAPPFSSCSEPTAVDVQFQIEKTSTLYGWLPIQANSGDQIVFDWYDTNGTLWRHDSSTLKEVVNGCIWNRMITDSLSHKPGAWGLTVTLNGKQVASSTFLLTAAEPRISSAVGAFTHIAWGGGWTTTTTLVNSNSTQARARLFFVDESGSPTNAPLVFPQSGDTATESYVDQQLPSKSLTIVQSSGDNTAPVQVGSTGVLTDSGVGGFATYRYIPTGQEVLVPLDTSVSDARNLPFDNSSGLATGVAIRNFAAVDATVPLTVLDDSGTQIGTGAVTIPHGGHTSFVLSDRFPVAAGKRGVLVVKTPSTGQVSTIGLRFTPAGTFTSIPVLSNVTNKGGVLAHVAAGGGVKSTILLVNTGSTSAQAHLYFFDEAGGPLSLPISFPQTGSATNASSIDKTMPPGSSLIVETTATQNQLIGSAKLITDGAISGFIIFGTTANGQEALVPLESRNASSYTLAFDNTGGTVTGIAISNAEHGADIQFIVRDDTGAQIDTGAVSLAFGGHSSFVLTDRVASTANKRGTIEGTAGLRQLRRFSDGCHTPRDLRFGGREPKRTEPLANGSAFVIAPSVGRFHGHLRTWVMPTCADSASPGLATIAGRRP